MVKRVRDAEGDKKEEIVEPVKTSRKEDTSTEEEPEPPEPFEYTEWEANYIYQLNDPE